MRSPISSPVPGILNTNRRGFSLIELLVVMGIIILIASLVAPSFSSIVLGTNLSRAGQVVGDEMILARQEAVTKNRDVTVRFYKWDDLGTSAWRGMQIVTDEQVDGVSKVRPLARMKALPQGVVFDPALSPLLDLGAVPVSGETSTPDKVTETASFRFRANGSTDPKFDVSESYVTLKSENDPSNPPDNYYTLVVNPVTGKITTYRP